MASGDDPRIPSHDNDDEGGENTILKVVGCLESLPEQRHFEDFDSQTPIDGLPTTIGLNELPRRVRVHIWNHLDWRSLQALSQTCSKFRSEIYQTFYGVRKSPFERFMDIMPCIPLNHYLDATTRDTLRLVCMRLEAIMELYDDSDRNYCRWGSSASLATCGFDNLSQVSSAKRLMHIFDLPVQDLKRILSYLEEFDLNTVGNVSQIFKRIVDELKVYRFEEFRDSYALQLMDLPFEVHHKVLSFCNSIDRQRLRLVSKLMQFQVDMVGVEVHLNDLKWRWNRCGKLPPAYSLVITNVECIQSVNYFTAEDNCNLLTRIVVDGKFPAKAMILVLERCKKLRFVGFTHALQMSSIEDELHKSFPVKRIPIELPSLRAIDLKIHETADSQSSNIFRVHSWTWANAFEFMKPNLFRIPRLASFYICEEAIITHNLMYEVAEKVLKFIVEHRKSLKYVSVILNGNCLRTCGCPPFPFKIPDNVLKEIKLAKFCHDCDWRISRPFASILSMQRSLKELVCFKLSDWEFYAGIIAHNKCSLQSVTIEKNLAPVIDLNAFSACVNLKRLWISQYSSPNLRQPSYSHFQTVRVDQRLTNLNTLPVNITNLHILDQTVDAAQIETIPQRLKKLEVLDLQFLGSWNGRSFGMSTETVKDILHLKNLKCLFLEEIRTLDACMEDTFFENALSEINLIPIQYSQLINSVGCVINGILVADRLPDSNFMPEWKSRVSCYFNNVVPPFDEVNYYNFLQEAVEEAFYEEDGEDEENEEYEEEEVLFNEEEGLEVQNEN